MKERNARQWNALQKRHGAARDFKCPRCDKAFVVAIDLRAHIKFVHDREGEL